MSKDQENDHRQRLDASIASVLKDLPQGLQGLREEICGIVRACLQQYLHRMDFVPRDLFDAQVKVLHRCQAELQTLKNEIEAKKK